MAHCHRAKQGQDRSFVFNCRLAQRPLCIAVAALTAATLTAATLTAATVVLGLQATVGQAGSNPHLL